MTCREFTSFIADYLTGELAPDVHAKFQRHLSLCDNCTQYLADYERTLALERGVFEQDTMLPPDVPESLVAAILAARVTKNSTD
jgi:predicted anti-sigma-YlaC factor YlaD